MVRKTPGKRQSGEIATGLFLLIHPIPVTIHIIAVTLLTLLAAWPTFQWQPIVLLIAAHTAMQLAIAILNDYCDRIPDAQSHKPKPIPSGLILPREALLLGILCIALMLLLLLPLNRLALLISLLYLTLGLAYNLGLKATPLSGIVFALAIPLIPVYAFVGVGHIIPLLAWFIPVAALLGIAINLANSLPDIPTDRASNVQTLAVVLGIQISILVCTCCVLLGATLIGLISFTHIVPANNYIVIPVLFIACATIVGAYVYIKKGQPEDLYQRYFYIVVSASLFLALGWIIGVLL